VSSKTNQRCAGSEDRQSLGSRFAAVAKSSLSSLPKYFFVTLAGFILVSALALVAGNFLSISFLFERNYNEGWNIFNTERIINHERIYDDNYWRVNNYPIGSFLIIAVINLLVHDLLLSGRIVALASFAVIGILAAAATRSFGGGRADAAFGGGCALGFCYLVAPAWIMVDDPQTLGEAVMLGALVAYISRPSGRLNLLSTAVLAVLGCFIKHNLLAIPLAITIDLMIRSPRRLLFWLVCCAALTIAFLGLTQIVAGGDFYDHLLSPRIFTWYGVRYHLMKYLRLFKFPLVAILLFSPLVFTERRMVLALWGITSVVVASILSGFEGASYNMFQDAAVFLGVAAGVAFYVVRTRLVEGRHCRRLAGVAFGVVPLVVSQPILARSAGAFSQLFHAADLMEFNRRSEAIFLAEAKYISERPGPAICESLLLCYVAGKAFTLDPFNSRQYILAGRLDPNDLIRRIAAQEFAVIQLRADICDGPATKSCHILHYPQKFNRFTDETLYAIDRHYRVGWRAQDGTLYVPK
jgi:hypothetical protein